MRLRGVQTLAACLCLGACLAACGGTVQNGAADSGGTMTPTDGGTNQDVTTQDVATMPDSGADAGPPDTGGPPVPYPAPHPPMPQVLNLGGPIMLMPKIVPIFFANDDPATDTQLESFVSMVGGSTYWSANAMEYGVGAAMGLPPIHLTEMAPTTIDDTGVAAWLANKFAAHDPAFGMPDSNTIYAIFYPVGTVVTLQGTTSCQQFGAYHNATTAGALPVSYAVMPRCPPTGPFTSMLDVTTASASHEFLEAVTDPQPQTNPAYGQVDNDHLIWMFAIGGGEIGDMCAQNPGVFYKPQGLGFEVQRTWSNAQAAASHDPCVPANGQPYFNSAPVLNDVINLNIGQPVQTKGVKIPVGQSKAVELDLYSDAPTSGPWSLRAVDGAMLMGGTPNLSFSFDKTSGQNGDKILMTITVQSASMFNAEAFLLLSQLGVKYSLWVGLVSNQ
jgi:hypothetical protein